VKQNITHYTQEL